MTSEEDIKNYISDVLATVIKCIKKDYPRYKSNPLYNNYPFLVKAYRSKQNKVLVAVVKHSDKEKIKITGPLSEADFRQKKKQLQRDMDLIHIFLISPPFTKEKAESKGKDLVMSIKSVEKISNKSLEMLNEQKKLNELGEEIDKKMFDVISKMVDEKIKKQTQVGTEIDEIREKFVKREEIKKKLEEIDEVNEGIPLTLPPRIEILEKKVEYLNNRLEREIESLDKRYKMDWGVLGGILALIGILVSVLLKILFFP